MVMLYMPSSFPATDLDAWFKPSARSEKEQALSNLDRLHILVSKRHDDSRDISYSLTPGFQRSLRQAIEGSGTHRSFGVPASKAESGGKRMTIEDLDMHAREQWEGILFFMVSGAAGFQPGSVKMDVGPGTRKLLHAGDLVRTVHGSPRITKEGFSFVLQETNAQVWNLLIVYLKMVNDVSISSPSSGHQTDHPQLGMSETEVLSFLFMLGSLELGQDYSTSTLSPTQLQMLDDLSAMGIVYRSSKESLTFYPTRLATTLTSDSGALPGSDISTSAKPDSKAQNKGFIIIETNYRLYAYTNSLIQIAILSLFTKLQHRFPNLISGKLTKESVHRAVQNGITSAQIISYLTTYAHPQMQKNNPPLPPTVTDQIRLWEYEGERVEVTNGYLMREFGSEAEYRDVLGYAEALGVLVWRNDAARCFFVSHVEQISGYLRKKKEGKGRA
jgi:transcription initiation factor TFIIH subunit 4